MNASQSTLRIQYIPSSISAMELCFIFEEFGRIVKVDIPSHHNGTPFGFVEFEDEFDAKSCLKIKQFVISYKGQDYTLQMELYERGTQTKTWIP